MTGNVYLIPLHLSNVMVLDSDSLKAVRIQTSFYPTGLTDSSVNF